MKNASRVFGYNQSNKIHFAKKRTGGYMKQKLKLTIGVICKSKRHKISLTEQGKLVFHDHLEGFKEESVLALSLIHI